MSFNGSRGLPLWTAWLAIPPFLVAIFYDYQVNKISIQSEALLNLEPFQMACIGVALAFALPPIAVRFCDHFLGLSQSNR